MLQFRLQTHRGFQKNNYYTSKHIARQQLSGVGDKNRTCFHGFAIQCPSNWLHLHNSGTPSRNRTHIHSLEESCILHYTIGIMVRMARLELARLSSADFKSAVVTNFTTPAKNLLYHNQSYMSTTIWYPCSDSN